jgi:hypothetical protein
MIQRFSTLGLTKSDSILYYTSRAEAECMTNFRAMSAEKDKKMQRKTKEMYDRRVYIRDSSSEFQVQKLKTALL